MMTGGEVTVPRNILRFEILLYLSLLIDALSFLFRDVPADVSDSTLMATNVASACLILLFFALVWLAARRHKNWARWMLLIALVLSTVSLAAVVGQEGWQIENLIDLVSSGLTALGLFFSFHGDAQGWFRADAS